jgi:hypothetical protein
VFAAWEVVVAWAMTGGVCTEALGVEGGVGEMVTAGASWLLSGLSASSNVFASASNLDSTCWQPLKAKTSHNTFVRKKRPFTESWPAASSKYAIFIIFF